MDDDHEHLDLEGIQTRARERVTELYEETVKQEPSFCWVCAQIGAILMQRAQVEAVLEVTPVDDEGREFMAAQLVRLIAVPFPKHKVHGVVVNQN